MPPGFAAVGGTAFVFLLAFACSLAREPQPLHLTIPSCKEPAWLLQVHSRLCPERFVRG